MSFWVWVLWGCTQDESKSVAQQSADEQAETVGNSSTTNTDETTSTTTEDDTTTVTDIEIPCEAIALEYDPLPDAEGVFYRSPITVILSHEDDSAVISVQANGTAVDGEVVIVDNRVQFTPSTGFLPEMTHQVELSFCHAQKGESFVFTTSEVGKPLEVELGAQTFPVDLRYGTWVKPQGVGPILAAQTTQSLLFGLIDNGNAELNWRFSISEAERYSQYFCFPTLENMPAIDISQDPYFEIVAPSVMVNISGYDFAFYDFLLSGVLAPDGLSYSHGVLDAVIDARSLSHLLGMSGDDICALVEALGAPCASCPGDGQPFCVDMQVEDLVGDDTNIPLECVLYANCHPSCGQNQCANPVPSVCE